NQLAIFQPNTRRPIPRVLIFPGIFLASQRRLGIARSSSHLLLYLFFRFLSRRLVRVMQDRDPIRLAAAEITIEHMEQYRIKRKTFFGVGWDPPSQLFLWHQHLS